MIYLETEDLTAMCPKAAKNHHVKWWMAGRGMSVLLSQTRDKVVHVCALYLL